MPNRPPAAQVARLDTPIVHALLSGDGADGLNVFVNGVPVPAGQVESLTVEIVAPDDQNPEGRIAAVLSRYESGPDGPRQTGVGLFPGTIEIVGKGRRLSLSCPTAGSFDGLWLGLGLRPDGSADGLQGVKRLHVILAPGLAADARLTWADGGEESVF